jgi:hypothetical protein
MPNVLDIDPLRALAKRASARIGDQTIAKRYERLAIDRLLKNPLCFRPARERDLAAAPAWAQAAHARGEIVSVYRPNSGMAARLHTVARRIVDTYRLAAMDQDAKPDQADTIKDARRFLAKFGHMNFNAVARKALGFSQALASWEGDLDATEVCPAQSIVLLGGRIWHRVTSVAELRAIGREFSNCLTRTSRLAGYGAMLARGHAQFWVLRDVHGQGLIIACANAPLATQFIEVKGPRNTPVHPDHADLARLGIAIGVRPTPPTPPLPPASPAFGATPTGLIDLIEQLHRRCHCQLCDPAFAPRPRLRPRTAAP